MLIQKDQSGSNDPTYLYNLAHMLFYEQKENDYIY